MSISYTQGIPASNHAPSADQPPMMVNNDHNFTIWDVDHFTFNSSPPSGPSGMHEKVTFPVTSTVPGLSNLQTQIYPQTFTGSSTNILETYTSATNPSGAQLNGYLPFVKCMGQYVSLTNATGTLSPNANSLNINIASVVQSTTSILGDTITITFTQALPTVNYYVFFTEDTRTSILTKGLTTIVLMNALFKNGIPLAFMVI